MVTMGGWGNKVARVLPVVVEKARGATTFD
jgi:hypothetical protein